MKNILIISTSVLLISFGLASCNPGAGAGSQQVAGYDYIVHQEGGGDAVNPGDFVSFTLKIVDDQGKVYQENSSEPLPAVQIPTADQPAPEPNPIIELLGMSTVGDSLELIMPKDSLQGPMPDGNDDLKSISYVVKLVRSQNEEAYKAEVEEQKKKDAAKAEVIKAKELEVKRMVDEIAKTIDDGSADIKTTESGLKYILHNEGSGPKATTGDVVDVFYYGTLEDGTEFDNAYKRGREFQFTVDQGMVIKGWDEGLQLLNEGATATLIVPSELGYGDQATGSIPAGSTLRFYVELADIK